MLQLIDSFLISKINPNIDKIKWYSYDYSSDWRNNYIDWEGIFI